MCKKKLLVVSGDPLFATMCFQKLKSRFDVIFLDPGLNSRRNYFSKNIVGALFNYEELVYKPRCRNSLYFLKNFFSCYIVEDLKQLLNIACELDFAIKNKVNRIESKNKLYFSQRITYPKKLSYKSNEYESFLQKVYKSSQNDLPVLLLGETGSGKDYTAELIHKLSSRKDFPFKNKNVAELNANLIESILFGVTKGAYTDAQETAGLFESAGKGTLFLDELAELPLELQSKLLGILDTKHFTRILSEKEILCEARMIFATNKDIFNLVKQNKFRSELYYRISVVVINIPPLRNHKEDISELSYKFINEYLPDEEKSISEKAMEALRNYSWPGNIRQLKNCITLACENSRGKKVIDEKDLEFW